MAKDKSKPSPHLIKDGRVQRCSICGFPFSGIWALTLGSAFAEHLKVAHKPGQTSEDANQAAFRVVREATKE